MSSVKVPTTLTENFVIEGRSLSVTSRLLYNFGVWPLENEPKNLLFYWRHFLPRIQFIRFIYTIIFNCISTYIVWGKLDSMTEYLVTVFFYVVCCLRVGSLYRYKHDIKNITICLENLSEISLRNNEQLKKTAKKTEKYLHRLLKILTESFVVVGVPGLILYIMYGLHARKIPFRLWLPYDYSSTPVFEISLITISTLCIFDLFMCFLPGILYLEFNIHIIGQYKLLRYNIDNIRKKVEQNMEVSQNNPSLNCEAIESGIEYTIVSLNETDDENRGEVDSYTEDVFNIERTVNVDEHVQEYDVALDGRCQVEVHQNSGSQHPEGSSDNQDGGQVVFRDISLNTINDAVRSGRRLRRAVRPVEVVQTLKSIAERKADLKTEKRLRDCVKHHQMILRVTQDIQRVFKATLCVELFGSAVTGLFALYVTTLASTLDYQGFLLIYLMLIANCESCFMCILGSRITEQSEKLREAVYGCEWYGASESFKRSIRIMISRTNKPEVLKAAGLPLSVKTFRLVLRTGYYLHSIMVKIIHGVKINDKIG